MSEDRNFKVTGKGNLEKTISDLGDERSEVFGSMGADDLKPSINDGAVDKAVRKDLRKELTLGDVADAVRTGDWSKFPSPPKSGHNTCHGRGYIGFLTNTRLGGPQLYQPCRCIFRKGAHNAQKKTYL